MDAQERSYEHGCSIQSVRRAGRQRFLCREDSKGALGYPHTDQPPLFCPPTACSSVRLCRALGARYFGERLATDASASRLICRVRSFRLALRPFLPKLLRAPQEAVVRRRAHDAVRVGVGRDAGRYDLNAATALAALPKSGPAVGSTAVWSRSTRTRSASRRPVLCCGPAIPTPRPVADGSPATCRDRRGCATKRYRVISSASEGGDHHEAHTCRGSGSSDARSSKCTEGGTGNRLSRFAVSLCRPAQSHFRRAAPTSQPPPSSRVRRPSASSRARSILWIHRHPTSTSRSTCLPSGTARASTTAAAGTTAQPRLRPRAGEVQSGGCADPRRTRLRHLGAATAGTSP